MKKETLLQAIDNKQIKKGVIIKAKWQSFPNKKNTDIVKVSEGFVKTGIFYGNLRVIKERNLTDNVTIDLNTYVSPFKNYHTVKGYETYLLEHNDNGKTNVILYLPYGFKNLKSTVKYYYKGNEVSKQWLLDNGLVKDYMVTSGNNETGRFTVDINNLLQLGTIA